MPAQDTGDTSTMLPASCLKSSLNTRRAMNPRKLEAREITFSEMQEYRAERGKKMLKREELTIPLKQHRYLRVMTICVMTPHFQKCQRGTVLIVTSQNFSLQNRDWENWRRVSYKICFMCSDALGYRLIQFAYLLLLNLLWQKTLKVFVDTTEWLFRFNSTDSSAALTERSIC